MTLFPVRSRWPSSRVFGLVVPLVCATGVRLAHAGLWPTEIEHLARRLASPQEAQRRGAARDLEALPDEVVAPLLLRALDDPDREVRLGAAAAAMSRVLPGVEARVVSWLNDS